MSNSTTSFRIIADYSWSVYSMALVLAWREFLSALQADYFRIARDRIEKAERAARQIEMELV